ATRSEWPAWCEAKSAEQGGQLPRAQGVFKLGTRGAHACTKVAQSPEARCQVGAARAQNDGQPAQGAPSDDDEDEDCTAPSLPGAVSDSSLSRRRATAAGTRLRPPGRPCRQAARRAPQR
ncbi:unnamed protein product, partial [Prorocentrum cordatum]